MVSDSLFFFFFQAEDGIRDYKVTGVQTCALPIWHFSPPVKGTFQLSLTLLVHYRSRGVFRVGCLCHPPSRAISDARYSGYPESPSSRTSTGLSPSLASAFHRSSSWRGQVCRSPNTTRPPPFSGGFGLLCTLFDRLY